MPAPPSLPGARAPGALGRRLARHSPPCTLSSREPLPTLSDSARHSLRGESRRLPAPPGGPAGVLAAPTPQSPASVPMSRGWAQPSYRGAQGSAPDGW